MKLLLVTFLSVLDLITGVQIDYKDICGQKLFETCPSVINTKIVGGDSTCAEKVPWNVLIENINGEKSRGGYHSSLASLGFPFSMIRSLMIVLMI